MRFDFSPFFNPGENIPWDRVVDMMREQTQLAEQAGFETVWLSEHHFAHNGYMNAPPNPILMGADLAAHCKRIRVGQCPVVLPDWHPLRVAEDVALLDNMTKGRVEFGAGRGVNERTTLNFNLKADRRDGKMCDALFRECLDIIMKAWTEDPFVYKGEFYEFPVPGWHETNRVFQPLDERNHRADDGEYVGMYVHPRPFQDPHPPVWLMSNTPETYQFAGAGGMNVIGMASPPGKVRVCESTNIFYEMMNGWRPSGDWARRAYLDDNEELSENDRDGDWYDFLLAHDIIWAGTPEYVAEKIQRLQEELGLRHIMLIEPFVGLSYQKILESMTLFGEQVIPRIKSVEANKERVTA